jgi:hypothetical protein
MLIYAGWLEDYGDGKATLAGIATAGGDDFSDFSVQSASKIKGRLERTRKKIEQYEIGLIELLTEKGCIGCEDTGACNCENECNCEVATSTVSSASFVNYESDFL